MKKVIFRADGNSETGLGHLYRLFSLAETIKGKIDFVFVVSQKSTITVIPKDYRIETIPESVSLELESTWLAERYSPKEYIIVADGYHFNSNYQKDIKSKGYKLIYIDDLANEHMFADLVINHSPYITNSNYSKEGYTQLYLGTKYALLRPSFLESAKKTRIIKKLDIAFVCFGGADPENLTLTVVKALIQISNFKKINIILGNAYIHQEIYDLQHKYDDRIEIFRNLSEKVLIGIMEKSNFAIVPSSTILYEVCCVKMPVLSGYFVENQKPIYQGLLDKKVIIPAGDFTKYTIDNFKEKVSDAICNIDINDYLQSQSKLFDKHIASRLLELVKSVIFDEKKLRIRKAEEYDLQLFFDWANDDLTRKMSFNSNKISLKTHTEWFNNQLQVNDNILLVVDIEENLINKPVGQVKFDKEGVIGISLDKDYRGKNLGVKVIEEGLKYIKNNADFENIIAFIKSNNIGSIKIFEKSGFIKSEELSINNEECFKYICSLSK